MRTDCTIDNRRIPCPNATHLGFAKRFAKAGDIISYNDGSGERIARVLGRVSAPSNGSGPVKGFILALVLDKTATSAYERWVNPAFVTEIRDCPSAFAAFFFAPTLPYDAQTMRRLGEYGTLSEHYIGNAVDHVASWTKESA